MGTFVNRPIIPRGITAILLVLVFFVAWVMPSSGPTLMAPHDRSDAIKFQQRNNLAQLVAKKSKKLTVKEQWRLALIIEKVANKYQIDPILILSIIRIESNYDPRAISPARAMGLMQIRPFVAQEVAQNLSLPWHNELDLYQMEWNITLGAAYFNQLLERFDFNLLHALTAYNHGPTRIRSLLNQKKELPLQYAQKVLNVYQNLAHVEI